MKLPLLELDCQATGKYNNCPWSKFEMKLLVQFVVHDKQRLEGNKLSNSRLFIVDLLLLQSALQPLVGFWPAQLSLSILSRTVLQSAVPSGTSNSQLGEEPGI
jgi:hypothetical protein